MPGLVSYLVEVRSAGFIPVLFQAMTAILLRLILRCVPVRPILQCARDIRGELTATSTCRTQIVRDVQMEGRPRVPSKAAEVFLPTWHLSFSFLQER